VLTGLELSGPVAAAVAALLVGGGSGSGMAYAIHKLKQKTVGEVAGVVDFLGREATVTVRIAPGTVGKVRLQLHDGLTELLAEADEEIPRGAKVLIYDMEGATARVSRTMPDPLREEPPRETQAQQLAEQGAGRDGHDG